MRKTLSLNDHNTYHKYVAKRKIRNDVITVSSSLNSLISQRYNEKNNEMSMDSKYLYIKSRDVQ